MEFDLENPFTCSREDESPPEELYGAATSASIEALFVAESDHSPAAGDLSARRSAVSLILQVLLNFLELCDDLKSKCEKS